MTGPREIFERFCSPLIYAVRKYKPENDIIELSILIYVTFFLIINLSNVSLLSSTGWAPYEPYSPEPVNESVLTDESPVISAKYWDEDGDAGQLRFYDFSGTLIDSCSVNNGSRCGVEWGAASSHDNYWYAIAEDDEGDTAEGPWWYFLINNPPESINTPDNPSDGSTVYGDTVKLEVTVDDPDGDEMDVEFLNNISNSSYSERTDKNVDSGRKAFIDKELERGKTYKWWVNVSDDWNSTKSGHWTFYVNRLARLQDYEPEDDSLVRGDNVKLNVSPSDQDDDQFYAYFFKRDQFLGKDSGVTGEKLSSDQWEGLRLGRSYEWSVNLSDGHENKTFGTFEFLRTSTSSYRLKIEVDKKYSSLITSTESKKITRLHVKNRLSTEKSINLYLEGMNAYFQENNKSRLAYTLKPSEERDFIIVIDPTSVGDQELNIITEEIGIGLNTTKKVPVLVREIPAVSESREVPGIELFQLIILLLSAVFLYARS